MKINGKYLEEFLDSHNLSPEKLGKKLDISGEAVRKIIRTESTKESTAELMGITVRTCTIYYKITNKKIDAEFKPWHSI